MGLPFDHAIRNLGRRPGRTTLTALSSAMVAALLVATTAFVRGLSGTFAGASDPHTALLLSKVAERDVVRSTTAAGLASLVKASVPGVEVASDEIHMGTSIVVPGFEGERAGFVRGVTPNAYEVHRALTLSEGALPGPGEVIVGRLVARQLGVPESAVAPGETLVLEGAEQRIVGRFVAPGTTLEAEIWTPLDPLRGLAQRGDSSVVFVRLADDTARKRLRLFCDRRLDLELEPVRSAEYYGELVAYFVPIQRMAWMLAALIGVAALLGGANAAAASVQDRIKELAALRAIGFGTRALATSLLIEALVVAAAGAVLGLLLARVALEGGAVRLAMSAFELRVDPVAVLVGFGGTLVLAVAAVVPAAWRLARLPIAAALSED
ncbi:FtsX-like permease family protein [Planctomycetes bacterium Poly30]|uniref:FtsX-like permease family protein n=2 Tax=Saltatorellus ferox TaxID=2528018 RepID=A0A518EUT8_9BACT|nr:FtsX-like permease family protein [Planctomycetes bacterium Poly30]